MQNRARSLTPQQKKALLQAIIERYERSPETVKKALPEVAEIMAGSKPVTKRAEYGGLFQLTPLEKQRREESFKKALHQLHKHEAISKEEAIQALEDAASLIEAFPFEPLELSKQDIAKLIKLASGLSVTTKGKRQNSILQEGEPAREVYLLRGVKLNLSWDKKLLSVEIDPKEMALEATALSIIGIGSDTATDLSIRHDDYFVEAISER